VSEYCFSTVNSLGAANYRRRRRKRRKRDEEEVVVKQGDVFHSLVSGYFDFIRQIYNFIFCYSIHIFH
jgi:hypothetical protein